MTLGRCAFAAAALATTAALAGCGLQQDISSDAPQAITSPTPAPLITGVLLDGSHFSSAALHGRVLVIDFWGSWCGPCRSEQPAINALYTSFAPRGVAFLGVDMREADPASGMAYRADFDVPYQSVDDTSEQISAGFDVVAPPTIVVVDRRGLIVARFLGTLDPGSGTVSLAQELSSLLG